MTKKKKNPKCFFTRPTYLNTIYDNKGKPLKNLTTKVNSSVYLSHFSGYNAMTKSKLFKDDETIFINQMLSRRKNRIDNFST